MPQTLLDKIWSAHLVRDQSADAPAILYIDLHLIHEVTSPQAFDELRQRGLPVRRPERTLATMDHSTPTLPADAHGRRPFHDAATIAQVRALELNCKSFGIELHGFDSPQRGIVHVLGPEVGATQPGMTIVCGDSHTATHGAFGALAFGIGTTEVGHVLATQCLLQRKPKSMAINVEGELAAGVSAKDLILHIIGVLGMDGGTGYVLEYRGSTIRALDMEARMTLCNMSIEAGARAGLVAADQITVDYLRGRAQVPQGKAFDVAAQRWLACHSDVDASFDAEIEIDASTVRPTITWGTNPGQVIAIDAPIPAFDDDRSQKALAYMGFQAGHSVLGEKVDVVFIGSCTNSRISDLRVAADVLRGRRVAAHVRALVVPGSEVVKREAEAEGLDQIFRDAGAQWREPGCSMCIAMNGDLVAPGELAVSTSNRNFEGRQGPRARTVLASPRVAAACAIAGCIADPDQLLAPIGAAA
jgi:3-isopropylmalate/(R)-2-methylmalate dehydratase large subunit